jgi:hypothetical protein
MSFSARARALRAEQIVRDLTVVLAARGQTNTRNAPLDMRDTIEALAVEVERIAEGQRFTTRLLSEARIDRGMIASDNSHGRSITPH